MGLCWSAIQVVRVGFEIVLAVAWMAHTHPELLASVLPSYPEKYANGGGSLWMRRG